MIIGGVLVAVAVLIVVIVSLSGGGGGSPAISTPQQGAGANGTTTTSARSAPAKKSSKSAASGAAARPSETSVVVLNGTETTGLAHHVSAELQQSGYAKATPLGGRPPGANSVTVVEYAGGHQADAQRVARTLGSAHVGPMEATVASLAGSATVVVIVGLDKAATAP